MLLEYDLPMSKETCVPQGGTFASTFAEDIKTEILKALSSNMLALVIF